MESHITHLIMVFNTICDTSLSANLNKCTFTKEIIDYLGH